MATHAVFGGICVLTWLQSPSLIATALLMMRSIYISTAVAVLLVLLAACAAAASTDDDGGTATQGSGSLQEIVATARLKVRC